MDRLPVHDALVRVPHVGHLLPYVFVSHCLPLVLPANVYVLYLMDDPPSLLRMTSEAVSHKRHGSPMRIRHLVVLVQTVNGKGKAMKRCMRSLHERQAEKMGKRRERRRERERNALCACVNARPQQKSG